MTGSPSHTLRQWILTFDTDRVQVRAKNLLNDIASRSELVTGTHRAAVRLRYIDMGMQVCEIEGSVPS